MAEQVFQPGAFVCCWDRFHGESVIGRVICLRGSEYHVSWLSANNGLFEMCFPPSDLKLVTLPKPKKPEEPKPIPLPESLK